MATGDDRGFREKANEFVIRRVVNTKERLRKLLKPGSLILLGVVTLTGTGAILKEAGVPSASFWEWRSPASAALAIVAAFSYVGYCLVVIGTRARSRAL